VIRALRIVAQRGFAGIDLVEVVPEFDDPAGTTSTLASRTLTEALACLALARKQGYGV